MSVGAGPASDPKETHEDLGKRILLLYSRRAATGLDGGRVLALYLEAGDLLHGEPPSRRAAGEAMDRASSILDRLEVRMEAPANPGAVGETSDGRTAGNGRRSA